MLVSQSFGTPVSKLPLQSALPAGQSSQLLEVGLQNLGTSKTFSDLHKSLVVVAELHSTHCPLSQIGLLKGHLPSVVPQKHLPTEQVWPEPRSLQLFEHEPQVELELKISVSQSAATPTSAIELRQFANPVGQAVQFLFVVKSQKVEELQAENTPALQEHVPATHVGVLPLHAFPHAPQ
jgi:hypothetical protein